MNLHFLKEPLLQFGNGTHVCPRAGISQYGVYDLNFGLARRKEILVGVVGTSNLIASFQGWGEKFSSFIPAKKGNKQPNLFTSFCGFREDIGFNCKLVIDEFLTKQIYNNEIKSLKKIGDWDERVVSAAELYYEKVKFLTENRTVDVVVCLIPDNLYNQIAKRSVKPIEEVIEDDETPFFETDFRRVLKAKTMHLDKPIQLLRESSLRFYPEDGRRTSMQDDATKAWNLCTALYYKAAKTTVPWRLVREENKASTCFVGIGFYRSRDRKITHTSLAQVFDELGKGVILRGTPVDIDEKDKRPHLSEEQAYLLLKNALNEYRMALENFPSRIVIHKSSNFREYEIEGFTKALEEAHIHTHDFVTILDTNLKLLRDGLFPPYRGTYMELDESNHLLYTRGAVPYYKTYPGMYIPAPIEIRAFDSDSSPYDICKEVFALTKMNWNDTQFDGKYPITLGFARRVGQIMKYIDPSEKPRINPAFYM